MRKERIYRGVVAEALWDVMDDYVSAEEASLGERHGVTHWAAFWEPWAGPGDPPRAIVGFRDTDPVLALVEWRKDEGIWDEGEAPYPILRVRGSKEEIEGALAGLPVGISHCSHCQGWCRVAPLRGWRKERASVMWQAWRRLRAKMALGWPGE